MEYLPFVIMGFIIIGVIYGAIRAQRLEKQRSEQIEAMAEQLGLPYHAKADAGLLGQLANFKLFSTGRRRTITNMLYGEADGVSLALFDYQYTIGGGKNSQTLRQSVVYIRSQELDLPQFALGPENFLHRLGQMMGMQDIDFDSHPVFSKTFLLRGPNEEAIRRLFNTDRLNALEKSPTVSIEGQGDQLAVFHANIRTQPDKLGELMNSGFEMYRLFASS